MARENAVPTVPSSKRVLRLQHSKRFSLRKNGRWIDNVFIDYNTVRPHSSLKYLTQTTLTRDTDSLFVLGPNLGCTPFAVQQPGQAKLVAPVCLQRLVGQ